MIDLINLIDNSKEGLQQGKILPEVIFLLEKFYFLEKYFYFL